MEPTKLREWGENHISAKSRSIGKSYQEIQNKTRTNLESESNITNVFSGGGEGRVVGYEWKRQFEFRDDDKFDIKRFR